MTETLREQWTPPERPEWVARINAEGAILDARGVVPLDENSLLGSARANTGLSDFGADDWIEPFRVLLRSLEEEAELSMIGRILARSDLLMYLEARLGIEDWYKRHPEIDEEQIVAPMIVVGQGRSGTSFLHNLLELDPDNKTCRTWEAMLPVPPPEVATYDSDPRIPIAHGRISQWVRVNPTLETLHELTGEIPTESIHLQAPSFQAPGWLTTLGQIPSYFGYIESIGYTGALEYEKRFWKLLQWRNPRRRTIMKSSDYLRYLPTVFEVFPDARVIWSHRDPTKALASMVNMMGTLFWMRSDTIRMAGMVDSLTDHEASAAMLSLPIEWLESGVVPRAQLCDIQYRDLVDAPEATIARIYEYFGEALSGAAHEAIADYMRRHPRSARPAHAYVVKADEEGPERRAYRRYQDYFGVPSES